MPKRNFVLPTFSLPISKRSTSQCEEGIAMPLPIVAQKLNPLKLVKLAEKQKVQ